MKFDRLTIIMAVIATVMAVYHWVTTQYLLLDSLRHQNLHLAFAFVLVFLAGLRKSGSRANWAFLIALIAVSIAATGYVQFYADHLQMQVGGVTTSDMIVGIVLILLLLEASRRAFGISIPIVTLVFIGYALFGKFLPGSIQAPDLDFSKQIAKLGMGVTGGIYGTLLAISADYIFLFVFFGVIMGTSGAIDFFIQVGRMIGRKVRAGPALTSVVTSALIGTITGSVAANVATAGSFTIPLMKKQGYRPEQAAAIEAASGSGGQITPPVLGTAAFVMVGITAIPYVDIMVATIIPAVLYYICAASYVILHAEKMKLTPIVEELDKKRLLISMPLFIIPLGVLVTLLILRYSPIYSVSWGMVALVVMSALSQFVKEMRRPWKVWIDGIIRGAESGAQIGVTCATIGMVVAVFAYTGLGVKLPGIVQGISGGSVFAGLLMTALIAIVLGCGMPTVSVYVLTAMVLAPILVKLGVPLLTAHLFIFYFSIASCVTPPVAPGALMASRIAGAPYMKTTYEAMKVSVAMFIVPFLFVMCPLMLLRPQPLADGIIGLAMSVVIILDCQAAICGYFLAEATWLDRSLYLFSALLLLVFMAMQSYPWLAAGLAIFAGVSLRQWLRRRGMEKGPSPA